jgi:hypothetical protein
MWIRKICRSIISEHRHSVIVRHEETREETQKLNRHDTSNMSVLIHAYFPSKRNRSHVLYLHDQHLVSQYMLNKNIKLRWVC